MDLGAKEALPKPQLCLLFRTPDRKDEAEDPQYIGIRAGIVA